MAQPAQSLGDQCPKLRRALAQLSRGPRWTWGQAPGPGSHPGAPQGAFLDRFDRLSRCTGPQVLGPAKPITNRPAAAPGGSQPASAASGLAKAARDSDLDTYYATGAPVMSRLGCANRSEIEAISTC